MPRFMVCLMTYLSLCLGVARVVVGQDCNDNGTIDADDIFFGNVLQPQEVA